MELMELRVGLRPDPWLDQQLSMIQFKTLLLLRPGAMRVGAVAEAVGLSPNATTSLVNALEQQGLVVRNLDPADRRAWRVSISAAGLRTLNDLTTAGVNDLLDHLGRLTVVELQALQLGMRALHRALDERIREQHPTDIADRPAS